jgi:hypothetical protein
MDEQLNKNNIKERMCRIAADYLEVNRSEPLDPVVVLFLESLAEEIYKVSGEIDNMENRISDKLSQLFVTDIETIVKPAYFLIHVPATENGIMLTTGDEFVCSGRHNRNEWTFYPACNTRIWKGDIRYFIHNGSIYSIDNQQEKMLLTNHGRKDYFLKNSFCLVLELDESIENLSGLSFYINRQDIRDEEVYPNRMLSSQWSIRGENLPMTGGLFSTFSTEEVYENDALELVYKYDSSNKINRSVKSVYDNCFLTVAGDFNPQDKRELFPEKLKSAFPSTVTESFTRPLLWIEVTCPPEFTADIIDSMQVSINVLPVVNKQLISKTIEVHKATPLIPLKTAGNESFIAIRSLMDSNGKRYYDIPVNKSETEDYGIYSLIRGGLERYNNRDAGEYLGSLLDSLTGEVSAFFNNRNDLKNDLKKIEEEVNGVVKHLSKMIYERKDHYEIENYLHIHQEEVEKTYFVEYWITQDIDAGYVKKESIFRSTNGLPIDRASVLSSVREIRYAPARTDKNKLQKSALSHYPLLVTSEDIRDFCVRNFSHIIREVMVINGLMEIRNSDAGFIRTTDVYVQPEKGLENYFNTRGKDFFEQMLKENSPASFCIRVYVGS